MDFLNEQPSSRNVSNSEVTAFLSCKRQYKYAFLMDLEPKETSDPLARGTLGHYAFEIYWGERLLGKSHEASLSRALDVFANPPSEVPLNVVMQTQFLWHRYMTAHNGFPTWEPLGTEVQHDLQLTSTINMTIKYDFYFKDLTTNKCYILDYKFAYNFWSPEDHDLNGQMPKYVAALQANGFQVDGGYLEEIRTRELSAESQRDPKKLWRRTLYVPSIARKQSVLRQHVAASLEIEKFRNMSPEERESVALPVLNKHGACKFCNFKDLCVAELEGKKDLSVDIRVGYQPNSYGYNKKEVDFI